MITILRGDCRTIPLATFEPPRAGRRWTKKERGKVTYQKLYAILRKAGFGAAKWSTSGMVRGWGDWSSGVHIRRDSEWLDVTYMTSGRGEHGRIENVMHNYIVPALEAAGVRGRWVDETTYRVNSEISL